MRHTVHHNGMQTGVQQYLGEVGGCGVIAKDCCHIGAKEAQKIGHTQASVDLLAGGVAGAVVAAGAGAAGVAGVAGVGAVSLVAAAGATAGVSLAELLSLGVAR